MLGKNNRALQEQKAREQIQRWSLRRLNVAVLVASGGFLAFGGSRVHADPIKSEHTVSAPPRAGDGSPSEVTSEQKLDEASESKQAQAIT